MPENKEYRPLRLRAHDGDDLKIISAMTQDAILKVGDIAYLPKARRFAFVANRFVWETAGQRRRGAFARVRAGVHFDDVLSVRQMNIRADAKDAVLELLAIRFEPAADGAGAVILEFSGGGGVRLDVEAINAELSDLSPPWPARRRPDHQD